MTTRRDVLTLASLAIAAVASPSSVFGKPTGPGRRKVHLFSKHLQWLDYARMAETAAMIGFDGVDLTVRPGGHVLPENVESDLPRAVAAVRAVGLEIDRITTAVTDPDDPLDRRVLETAARLEIDSYRMGWLKYDRERPLPEQLDEYRKRLERLAGLNRSLGIHGAYQNHVGTGVGSPVWDIWLLLKDVDPRWLGARYDVRHAVAEGSESWELGLQLLAPYIRSLDMKDFIWAERDGTWGVESVPLGEGAVNFQRYFELLEQWSVEADMTLHLEYPLGGADKGKPKLSIPEEEVIRAMQQDLTYLRKWI